MIAALVYTISPIHDDAHYAACARSSPSSPDVDALYIKDPGGCCRRRARDADSRDQAAIGDKPLELHSHNTIGLAEMTYLDAPDLA